MTVLSGEAAPKDIAAALIEIGIVLKELCRLPSNADLEARTGYALARLAQVHHPRKEEEKS